MIFEAWQEELRAEFARLLLPSRVIHGGIHHERQQGRPQGGLSPFGWPGSQPGYRENPHGARARVPPTMVVAYRIPEEPDGADGSLSVLLPGHSSIREPSAALACGSGTVAV